MKIPARFRRLPQAFRRNPKLVTKYFVSILLWRILIYLAAIFILSIVAPRSIAAVRKIHPRAIIKLAKSIPTDIEKFLPKIGEIFLYYGRRFIDFTSLTIHNPGLALEVFLHFFRTNGTMISRMTRNATTFFVSFLLVKVAMIFIMPILSGVMLTVAGIRISMLLIFLTKFALNKIGNILGKIIHRAARELIPSN